MHLYAHVTGVLIVIIFIMGPEGGGGPDPHDPLAGSALGLRPIQRAGGGGGGGGAVRVKLRAKKMYFGQKGLGPERIH